MSLLSRIRAWCSRPPTFTVDIGPGGGPFVLTSSTYLTVEQVREILRLNNEELEHRIITGLKNGGYGIRPDSERPR